MARRDQRVQRAQQAIDSIGLGFDITQDICFPNFKRGQRLIQIDEQDCRDVNIPGGISVPNVPNSIKFRGGESYRIQSEVLTYSQMSEQFNQEMRLTGQIPSGHFCASFGLSGHLCKKCDATLKSLLAYDGCFIRRYAFELERFRCELPHHFNDHVPSSWNPDALARLIERFGTHIVVGVIMGGKDVLYARQEGPSYLEPTSLVKFLEDKASMRFTDSAENQCLPSKISCNNKENIVVIYNRRGGSDGVMRHSEWLETIDSEPDVISVFLLPLPTLLSRTPGNGFVGHAINLYMRHKPPIEDLSQFLQFQLPGQWAPEHSELLLGSHWKNQVKTGLRLGILDPMLYINTIPVDVGNRPVIGMRLQLEGVRSNRLAIHLKHLTSLPMGYPLSDNANSAYSSCDPYSCKFHKKVKWNSFAYVCTAPVESGDDVSIVTGALLQVSRNCLLLRLRFAKVVGAAPKKPPEWDQSCGGFSIVSRVGSVRLHENNPKPGEVTIASNIQFQRPAPVHTPKLQRFVDTTEMVRGAEVTPGYWVVSGARLSVQDREISLRVKYSLLSFGNGCIPFQCLNAQ